MSSIRQNSWTAALRDMRKDRAFVSSAERRAAAADRGFSKIAANRARDSARVRPFVVAGTFDRAAIMSAAIVAAKGRRAVTGEPWSVCLSAALKGTWQVAKAARRVSAH